MAIPPHNKMSQKVLTSDSPIHL